MGFRIHLKSVIAFIVLINLILLSTYLVLVVFKKGNIYPPPKTLSDFAGKPIPVGVRKIKSIESGDRENRYVVSGFVIKEPEVKDKKVYLDIALKYSQKEGYSNIVKIYIGELNDKIGVNMAKNGIESNTYKTYSVKEIYPLFKKYTQILFEVTTVVEEKLVDTPECKNTPGCKMIIELINSYGKDIEPYLDKLAKKEFAPVPKPIGIVSQVMFIN